MSKLTASYLAGFIDGEGYISLRKGKIRNRLYYTPIIKIASTDEWIIKWIKESYGGWYYKRLADSESNHKDSYYWDLSGKNLKPFLQKICPYLKLKKEQCKLVLKKIKIQETLMNGLPYKSISKINQQRKKKRIVNLSYRDKQRVEIQDIYLQLRKLNKRGK